MKWGTFSENALGELHVDGKRYKCEPRCPINKMDVIRVHLHYSDPEARQLLTVFGEEPEEKVETVYSDRLWQWNGPLYRNSLDIAYKLGFSDNTARY